ncbi:hypothetical protein SE18_00425 [Herpetosiphon geysericola]|uniref:Uncharacterized protein n=1 Tax=Herpetosiphon geysericola TaxID=70996 RepID=A0A0P6YE42_9CHLR|nr:hypothetical protein SE18_00425 [Herpetosiphon geysericola]
MKFIPLFNGSIRSSAFRKKLRSRLVSYSKLLKLKQQHFLNGSMGQHRVHKHSKLLQVMLDHSKHAVI